MRIVGFHTSQNQTLPPGEKKFFSGFLSPWDARIGLLRVARNLYTDTGRGVC